MILNPNADITIYNRYYDKKENIEKYQKTIIKRVNWQTKRESTVSDKGLLVANSTLIFIDNLKDYISPKKFRQLSDDERVKHFTLSAQDKIVKGILNFEVTGRSPNSISDLENKFDDVVSISTVSEFSNHIEVYCK